MARARLGQKPPVEGAVRCYPLAPVGTEDAFASAAAEMRRRGFEPIEQDYQQTLVGEYIEVALWAVPPAKPSAAEGSQDGDST